MSRDITQAVRTELEATQFKPITLYEVEFATGVIGYYAEYDIDVTFDGQVYTAVPVGHSNISTKSDGSISHVTVQIANANRAVGALIEQYQGLTNKQVKIRTVFADHLDDTTMVIERFWGYINTVRFPNAAVCEVEITSVLDIDDLVIPRRYYQREFCTFTYKDSDTCKHTGETSVFKATHQTYDDWTVLETLSATARISTSSNLYFWSLQSGLQPGGIARLFRAFPTPVLSEYTLVFTGRMPILSPQGDGYNVMIIDNTATTVSIYFNRNLIYTLDSDGNQATIYTGDLTPASVTTLNTEWKFHVKNADTPATAVVDFWHNNVLLATDVACGYKAGWPGNNTMLIQSSIAPAALASSWTAMEFRNWHVAQPTATCDKSVEACKARANLRNFGGFPLIPTDGIVRF